MIISKYAMAIDTSIDTYLKDIPFSGTVLVARKGEIIHHQAYGMSNYEKKTPNQTGTIFPIASVTKPLTAAIIMQLVEEEKLSLDSRLSKFVSHPFPIDPTIADLLHHTSGLNLYSDFTKHDTDRSQPLSADVFHRLMTPATKPDEPSGFQYNNGNYMLLGQVIEAVTQKTYQEYFAQKLFHPAKMQHTTFIQQTQCSTFHAHGYLKTDQGLSKAPSIHGSWLGCGAGIASTAQGLYQYIQAYLKEEIVNASTKQQMLEPTAYNYGLGWTLDKNSSAFYHEGGISGFSTMLFYVPKAELTIVALSNIETDIEEITRKIIEISSN